MLPLQHENTPLDRFKHRKRSWNRAEGFWLRLPPPKCADLILERSLIFITHVSFVYEHLMPRKTNI